MTRRRRAAVGGGLLLLALVVDVLLVGPTTVGLHGTAPFAQAVALRAVVAAGLVVAAVVLLALPWRRLLAGAATVLLLGAAVSVAVLGWRGLGGSGSGDREDRPDDAVVVLVLNTQGSLGAAELAPLVRERDADVVVLPETWGSVGEEVAAALDDGGPRMQVLTDDGTGVSETGATTLLVAERLGEYELVARHGGALSSFTAAPVDERSDAPSVSAVHPYPPLPGSMSAWRTETRAAVSLCEDGTSDVVAGDFNATLDHPALRALSTCVDAARVAGHGGVGTWPTGAPRLFGAAIDHVLVDPTGWSVDSAAVLDPPAGTDHRAVEAVLVPPRS